MKETAAVHGLADIKASQHTPKESKRRNQQSTLKGIFYETPDLLDLAGFCKVYMGAPKNYEELEQRLTSIEKKSEANKEEIAVYKAIYTAVCTIDLLCAMSFQQ